MRVILHIGMPKTGTSAIQTFLGAFRDKLFEEFSILYPKSVCYGKYPAHYPLAHVLLPINEVLKKRGIFWDIECLKKQLWDEIYEYQPKIVLLSCEDFYHFSRDTIYKFKNSYDLLVSDVICYVRRQDLAVESIYKQNVKDETYKLTVEFKNYIRDPNQLFKLRYYDVINQWKQALPESRIIVKVYDRKLFPNGNVISDFLKILGVELPEKTTARINVNPSLSYLSTLVMRKINEIFNFDVQTHKEVVNYLLKLDREEGNPSIESFFTLKERIEFLGRFKESNEKLFREYLGTEN